MDRRENIQEMQNMDTMSYWQSKLREFAKARDWDQFHSPENLAKCVAIEAGELLECFQWNDSFDKAALSEEIVDVMFYCMMLADHAEIDLPQAMQEKYARNDAKYPKEKCAGRSDKYTVYQEK